ncbi:MAG: hypothetical protein V7K88_29480 [Nostoc sp.]|uniref:hypothetical protein n=1 Tax=Nostoc sp. TaxID=1180 RepID=UPI002FFA389A
MNSIFRVPNSIFRVLNTIFRVLNSIFRVLNTIFRVLNSIFRVSISKDEYISLNDQLRNSKCLITNSMRSPFLFLYVAPVASSRGTRATHWLLSAWAVAYGKPLHVVQSSFCQ